MSKEKKPKIVLSLGIAAFETLVKEVYSFQEGYDDTTCDEDSFDINFYDTGKIQLVADFTSKEFKDINI